MILYFSPTGNSKLIAKAVAKRTGDRCIDALPYLKQNKYLVERDEKRLILCCPTHAWRAPKEFCELFKKSSFLHGSEVWFLMTCGGEIANAPKYLKALCKEKGLRYMGTAQIVMPENYIAMFQTPNERESDEIISAALLKLKPVISKIKQDMPICDRHVSIFGKLSSSVINKLFYPLCVHDRAFFAKDNCSGCGTCSALCPKNNIKLKDGKPTWNHDCIHCMACINACPQGAIEYGKKSENKPRHFLNDTKINTFLSKV